jgi:hypothetical protein
MARRSVLVVTPRPGGIEPRFSRLRDAATVLAVEALSSAPLRADTVWVDPDASGAAEVCQKAIAAGIPTLLGDAAAFAGDLQALADLAAERQVPFLVAGLGAGSLALTTLLGRVRAGELGPPHHVAVRSPAGRRLARASSRRTPFGPDQLVSWRFDAETAERLSGLAAPAWRLADLVVPGVAEALAPMEIVATHDAERLVANAIASGVSVEIEIDREMTGEGEWEVEVACPGGSYVARWSRGQEALLLLAPLRRPQIPLEPRTPEELLVRHVLSGNAARSGLAGAAQAAGAYRACREALAGAETRRARRPLAIVLVHVPRFRNSLDELRLPSLAVARLGAFARGYGFETRVVDLAADFDEEPLHAFADDESVNAYLAGHARPEIQSAVDRMWRPLSAALDGPCLVGFSIVDYFGHFQMNLASCLAQRVRRETGHPIVLGGERDQVDGGRALQAGMPFDWVVDGDGELALLKLAHHVAYGDRRAWEIPGVWGRGDDGAPFRNAVVRSHLNAMPRPDFDGMPFYKYFGQPTPQTWEALARDGLAPQEPVRPFAYLPYAFVKGCVAECTFCSAKEHLDVQSPEKSAGELLELAGRYGVRDFVFLNNLVNIGSKWLERFCRLLVDAQADLQWTDSCRPTGISGELAALMRAAGCLLLNFGAESGSDEVLIRMRKGLLARDTVETLRNTHRAGILNRVNLIAGYFHEKPKDVDATIALVETLREEIDVIGCFQGFYLFEGMGVDPVAEGIVLRPGLDRLKTGQVTLAYDEVGGLPWDEKKEVIDASRNRILARIEELGIRTIDKINEYDLFYLSRRFRDKATVTRYLLAEPTPRERLPNTAVLPPGGQRGRVVLAASTP